MNVVDSSGLLEYFADADNADFFAPAIENTAELVVPPVSLYEVFKRILQQKVKIRPCKPWHRCSRDRLWSWTRHWPYRRLA